MDRQIPDVWNIFSLSAGPDYNQRKQYVNHFNWSNFNDKWCDRSSPCDRPRTYDKFYHKLPGNYIDPLVKSSKSLCSSEAEDNSSEVEKGKKKRKKKRKYSRTITERDVRHLDRHLSMKKTIRKKIMRDLQQAFVQDNDSAPDNFQNLNFNPAKKAENEANLLDLLKQPEIDYSDSGHGTDPGPSPTQSVDRACHVVRSKQSVALEKSPKSYLISDSSSCGGYESAESEKDIIVLAAEQIQAIKIEPAKNQPVPVKKKQSFWKKLTANLKPSSS